MIKEDMTEKKVTIPYLINEHWKSEKIIDEN